MFSFSCKLIWGWRPSKEESVQRGPDGRRLDEIGDHGWNTSIGLFSAWWRALINAYPPATPISSSCMRLVRINQVRFLGGIATHRKVPCSCSKINDEVGAGVSDANLVQGSTPA